MRWGELACLWVFGLSFTLGSRVPGIIALVWAMYLILRRMYPSEPWWVLVIATALWPFIVMTIVIGEDAWDYD